MQKPENQGTRSKGSLLPDGAGLYFLGILEDVLKQNNIPYLKKDVMGAGLAIKVGPMFERSRFYVPFEQWSRATAITEDLFSGAEEAENRSE